MPPYRNVRGVGWGKDCTITATVLTNGLVQLDVLYEFKGDVIDDLMRAQAYTIRAECLLANGHASAAISIGARLWDEMSEHYKTRTCVRNAKAKP